MSARMEPINPEALGAPKGYQNGILVRGGAMLFVAGQIAWDANQQIVGSGDFVAQMRQTLKNFLCVVEAAGGNASDVVSMTVFVTDKHAYLGAIRGVGAVWKEVMGRNYPTMALVQVQALVEDEAMVEIQGIASIEEG